MKFIKGQFVHLDISKLSIKQDIWLRNLLTYSNKFKILGCTPGESNYLVSRMENKDERFYIFSERILDTYFCINPIFISLKCYA